MLLQLKCFVYSNYALQQYTVSEYVDALARCGYLNSAVYDVQSDFDVDCLIDDDLVAVMQYLFEASRVLQMTKLDLQLTVLVKCKRLTCVYDHTRRVFSGH